MSVTSSKIRIGTRASKLATAQSLEVKNLLIAQNKISQDRIEIVPIATSGDKIQDRNLADIGGKGLFIKELEEALVQNKIDIAVHSAKDVPPFLHDETQISAFTKRLSAQDCLISKKFDSLKQLPQGSVVGTSSARRKAILLRLRPDLKIVNFRGNVDTRLDKMGRDEVDASILAVCGLERIGRESFIKEIISKDEMLPAGGQGALILQTRKNDDKISEIVRKIDDEKARICLMSERVFLQELQASCSTPVAVYAYIENGLINLRTMILDYDGSEVFETVASDEVSLEAAISLARKAAEKTKLEAAILLNKIRQ